MFDPIDHLLTDQEKINAAICVIAMKPMPLRLCISLRAASSRLLGRSSLVEGVEPSVSFADGVDYRPMQIVAGSTKLLTTGASAAVHHPRPAKIVCARTRYADVD